MNTWFTSDHHFGHANIIKYCNRPFADAEVMNAALEKAWNETVAPEDLVYYLGDFAMSAALVPSIVRRLNGRKILIAGNHDKCWQEKDPDSRWYEHYVRAGFLEIYQKLYLEIAGESVLLSHLPYRNETQAEIEGNAEKAETQTDTQSETPTNTQSEAKTEKAETQTETQTGTKTGTKNEPKLRYFNHRPIDKGGWLIHGHVHQHWQVLGKQINVSVEVWDFKPANLQAIEEIILNGPQILGIESETQARSITY
jgi:calcineurin-like phosphoesterase family protein